MSFVEVEEGSSPGSFSIGGYTMKSPAGHSNVTGVPGSTSFPAPRSSRDRSLFHTSEDGR